MLTNAVRPLHTVNTSMNEVPFTKFYQNLSNHKKYKLTD